MLQLERGILILVYVSIFVKIILCDFQLIFRSMFWNRLEEDFVYILGLLIE